MISGKSFPRHVHHTASYFIRRGRLQADRFRAMCRLNPLTARQISDTCAGTMSPVQTQRKCRCAGHTEGVEGRERASSVLPATSGRGGPDIRTLWPPAAATSSAR